MPAPIRRRTLAREFAVQLLYQLDLRGDEVLAEVDTFLAEATKDEELAEFAKRLVVGARGSREATDARLSSVTRNWDVKRMAAIDRNILRMAIYELQHCPDVPPKVVINEAIELGKRYSTANSGAFINGILDRIRKDLENERGAAAPAATAEG